MELLRALAVLAEPPTAETLRVAEMLELGTEPSTAAYTELFLLQLYPYASVYLGLEGMLGGEARDRIAGAWRAVGAVPPPEPDHLAVLLAAHARAVELESSERDASRREARRRLRATLVWEHLLSWVGVYLVKIEEIAPPPYDAWGALLKRALVAETADLGPPATTPLALRQADEARHVDHDDLLGLVLAPIRSGLVLTRHDVARCANDLALGIRQGERRYVLQALLNQDAPRTVEWLTAEALRWVHLHRQEQTWLGEIASWWASRAQATAEYLNTRPAPRPA